MTDEPVLVVRAGSVSLRLVVTGQRRQGASTERPRDSPEATGSTTPSSTRPGRSTLPGRPRRAAPHSAHPFSSGNVKCTGYLYLPAVTGQVPCVVVGDAFSGTRNLGLGAGDGNRTRITSWKACQGTFPTGTDVRRTPSDLLFCPPSFPVVPPSFPVASGTDRARRGFPMGLGTRQLEQRNGRSGGRRSGLGLRVRRRCDGRSGVLPPVRLGGLPVRSERRS